MLVNRACLRLAVFTNERPGIITELSARMKLYRIRDWGTIYENNRTRELKSLAWVPVPNNHDGDGYTILVSQKDGAALFGAWVAVVQVASRCDPRGTLLRRLGLPHDPISLSRITRLPESIFARILIIATEQCNWLTVEELQLIPHEGATIPHPSAEIPHEGALNRREGKGTEGKEENGISMPCLAFPEVSESHHKDSRLALLWLNDRAGAHFRETDINLTIISARLSEPDVTIEGVKVMIERQTKLWKGTSMDVYLRPATLFGKSKFDNYYGQRDQPININGSPKKLTQDDRGFYAGCESPESPS